MGKPINAPGSAYVQDAVQAPEQPKRKESAAATHSRARVGSIVTFCAAAVAAFGGAYYVSDFVSRRVAASQNTSGSEFSLNPERFIDADYRQMAGTVGFDVAKATERQKWLYRNQPEIRFRIDKEREYAREHGIDLNLVRGNPKAVEEFKIGMYEWLSQREKKRVADEAAMQRIADASFEK